MTAYINKLKDKDGNQQLPITHERAVRDDNGTTAETKFQNLEGAMDRAYVAQSDNGMGRITLKKNTVSGVNTLTQSMMQDTNTIYVIQYDFTLGENITVPANCVLEFDGGSISADSGENKDTITGNNTGIQAGLVKIFDANVTLDGTWNVAESYPEWFGTKGDGTTDDTIAIQKTIEFGILTKAIVRFLAKTYKVTDTITINGKVKISGQVLPSLYTTSLQSVILYSNSDNKPTFNISNGIVSYTWNVSGKTSKVEIENINIVGVNNPSCCIYGSINCSVIKNVQITNFYIGIALTNSYECRIDRCYILHCNKNIILARCAPHCIIENCWLDCTGDIEQTPEAKITDTAIKSIYSQLGFDDYYTCVSLWKSELITIRDTAMEGSVVAIENRDTTLNGENLNFEVFSKYILYTTESGSTKKERASNILSNIFVNNAQGTNCSLGYGTYNSINKVTTPYPFFDNLDIPVYEEDSSFEYFSKRYGHKIVDLTYVNFEGLSSNNKSHYKDGQFVIDIEITGFNNWELTDGKLEIGTPKTWYDLGYNNVTDAILIQPNGRTPLRLRRNNRDSNYVISKFDGTNLVKSELLDATIVINHSYQMVN